MSLISRLNSLARIYLRRQETEALDDEEVRFYVEMLIASKRRDGFSEDEARREALIEVGGIEQVKEQVRESRTGYVIESLARDINYARRSLGRSPGFTLVACLTVALGVGFGSAIFSLVTGVMFRPLPYPESARLMSVSEVRPGSILEFVSYPNYLDWCAEQRVFTDLAAHMRTGGVFTGGEEPDRVTGRMVSANFFRTLGTVPSFGRFFTEAEDQPEGDRALVLGYEFWMRRFHGDREVVGRMIEFNGEPWRVVGILAPNFEFYGRLNHNNDFFIPLGRISAQQPFLADRMAPALNVIGRLGEGANVELARQGMQEVGQRLANRYPEANAGRRIVIVPFLETHFQTTGRTLRVLSGAVSLVVLIALGTVAALMLSRATTRHNEIALRLALGGTRLRVLRLLIAEAALLCVGGVLLGAGLAVAALAWLKSLTIGVLLRAEDVTLDLVPLGFVAVITLATAVFFHSLPFFRISAIGLRDTASGPGRQISEHLFHRRLRRAVVVVQFGLSVMLLLNSSLLLKSFWHLTKVNPGYERDGILTLQLVLPSAKYGDSERSQSFFKKTMERVAALPGVAAVSLSTGIPMGRSGEAPYWMEGKPQPENRSQWPTAYLLAISKEYHQTLQIPLLAGRYFQQEETNGLIVDEIFARQHFPRDGVASALGQRLKLPGDDEWREIVGVVGSVRHDRLDQDGTGALYVPWIPLASNTKGGMTDMFLIVKASGKVADLPPKIRAAVLALDPDQPIANVATMESLIRASYAPRRLNSSLLASFSLVALALAAVGSYGLLSYTVSQRHPRDRDSRRLGRAPPAHHRADRGGGVRTGFDRSRSRIGWRGLEHATAAAPAVRCFSVRIFPPTLPCCFLFYLSRFLRLCGPRRARHESIQLPLCDRNSKRRIPDRLRQMRF